MNSNLPDNIRDPELEIGQSVSYDRQPVGRVVDRRPTDDGDWEVDVKTPLGFVLPFNEAELQMIS